MKQVRVIFVVAVLTITLPLSAQTPSDITLPAPQQQGGMPLMQALKERKSTREYSIKKLSPQVLSNLLWAAFGISRTDGRRTAPSARNFQETDIYTVMQEGVYRYDAKENMLKLVAAGDYRKKTGAQAFVATAPLNLVYVADYSKMKGSKADQELYSSADVGFISQNVYLFCASEGLATVVRGWVNRDECAKVLKLGGKNKIVLTQTVGYPKE